MTYLRHYMDETYGDTATNCVTAALTERGEEQPSLFNYLRVGMHSHWKPSRVTFKRLLDDR